MSKPFLLDADVFIQAYHLHYRFAFAASFWKWIRDAHDADVLFSSQKVRQQIVAAGKTDLLRTWAIRMPAAFFLADIKSAPVMEVYRELVGQIYASSQYTAAAKNEFAQINNADAFLIASARAYGSVLITHEVPAPDSKKAVKIPDAAKLVGVKTDSIFNLLSKHAGPGFVFKPA